MSEFATNGTGEEERFRDIDRHLSAFVKELGGSDISAKTARIVSRELGDNHVCLVLDADNPRMAEYGQEDLPQVSPDEWKRALENDSVVVGRPGEYKPLIVDNGRVYLHKYYAFESRLAERLARMAGKGRSGDRDNGEAPSCVYAPEGSDPDTAELPPLEAADLQTAAVMAAAGSKLCVISGGPGTGKTTVLARIMAVLAETGPDLNIALAASTGKAAMRMNESVTAAVQGFDIPEEFKNRLLQTKAVTLHRLLGYSYRKKGFTYHSDRELPYDMVVVDEVSMIDLSLMTSLVDALAPHTGLVLLGDKNQLSSVEAGSVLADICSAFGVNRFSAKFAERVNRFVRDEKKNIIASHEKDANRFTDTVIHLERSFRFKSSAGIGKVSRKIVENASVASILEDMESGGKACVFRSFEEDGIAGMLAQEKTADRLMPFMRANDPEEALEKLSGFIILTPLGAGPWGVHEINRQTEAMLAEKGGADTAAEFYDHRPVLILENDYSLGLFNGDTGVILTDETGNRRAFFKGPDGIRQFIPGLLPLHQTAFAMTVHKSQGSEFTDVLFVIPDRSSPVMTRELVYTAVTRARKSVTIRGDRDVLADALNRQTVRSSGLKRLIRRYSASSDCQ